MRINRILFNALSSYIDHSLYGESFISIISETDDCIVGRFEYLDIYYKFKICGDNFSIINGENIIYSKKLNLNDDLNTIWENGYKAVKNNAKGLL